MIRNRSLPFSKALLVALGLTSMGPVPLAPLAFGLMPASMIAWGVTQMGAGQAKAQSRDPVVTSDTPEYCGVLLNRISGITHAAAMPPPTSAVALSEEGERMCVHGQTRGGIMRLRRALEIMRHGED